MLEEIFSELRKHYDPDSWWPAESSFEVAVGAVLTQNTNWNNVKKAINNLKELGALSPLGVLNLEEHQLLKAIRPAGFYTRKLMTLREIARFFLEFNPKEKTEELRNKLLSLKGIGKETADSILLYAFEKPVFVVDAYTLRFLKRYGLEIRMNYNGVQSLFHKVFPVDAGLFKELHALIVEHSKALCRKTPRCRECFLKKCKKAPKYGAFR
ncbi:hypothetical protein IX53_03780 [Kosmotoga pacifica]|uniref:HhH-GPD domain-containing protein n=1 Tax=Kosmotoga pacifica TaxID=1330330 RepID=A0A0G2Z9J9_9BACT|nr:hypothetical protein IX53_03780 [Kosmotoga pacifica]